MTNQCEMIIGYLVPHRCDHPALGRCTHCGRGFCEEHIKVTPGGLVCLACSQGLSQPVSLPETARNFSAEDIATFSSLSQWEEQESDIFSDLS